MSWAVESEGGVPVRMRWQPGPGPRGLSVRRCPRPWSHEPHGPWYTGEVYRLSEIDCGAFDCPGVPFPSEEKRVAACDPSDVPGLDSEK